VRIVLFWSGIYSKVLLPLIFNSTFRYIDDFHWSLYSSKPDIKDTTESSTSASYFDVLLNIDAGEKLLTQLYDNPDDFNFAIFNFPYICSNIPLSPVYGVYIYMYISTDSIWKDMLYIRSNFESGFLQSRLMSVFRKFYGRYNDLIYNYKLSLSHVLSNIFHTDS
jgi:hypothetical protein